MNEFHDALNESLEAMRDGRWDLDECLRRHPRHASELRPLLVAAAATMRAHDVQPREEFARDARERFLIATGERLQEAMDVEASPSFLASARVRFLLAAQRLRSEERSRQARARRRVPVFGSPFRVLAAGMAGVVLFLGFSTYTVASADAALPGDWQYPVKLQTERVRLALAVGDEAEREVKLDIAAERVEEIEKLAARGKIIGPGVLDRLKKQTEPLVEDVAEGDWDHEDAERLQAVAVKQKQVLDAVEPQVAADAQSNLDEAVDVARSAEENATKILVERDAPAIIAPSIRRTPTPVAPTPTDTPLASPTAADGSSPTATPVTSPTAEPTSAGSVDPIDVGETPSATFDDVEFYPLTAGKLQVLIPGQNDGWIMLDDPRVAVRPLLRIASPDESLALDGSSLIVFNTVNGDMYWHVNRNGFIHEVRMRLTQSDGSVLVADPEVLRAAYGPVADIPLFILESIAVTPDPTPTPEPTPAAPDSASP